MRKFTRSMASVVTATAVAFGAFAFLGTLANTAHAEEEHHPHHRLFEALKAIDAAEDYLEDMKHEFHGHKETCLKRLHEAQHVLIDILEDPA